MELPPNVRQQALHPFREVLLPSGWERIEREQILVTLHPMPIAKIVEPVRLAPEDVEAAVDEARAVVSAAGASLLAWWITPEVAPIGERLEALGLVNQDTPGFEAVENAMALTEAPRGPRVEGLVVSGVDSFEDFAAANRVTAAAFEMPPAMCDELEAALPDQYEQYATPGNTLRIFNASIDGSVVGTAAAALGTAGVNLFGGSVRSEARGRGVYRALTEARWNFAVEHGTPALTIQAGKMSKPIAEQLGFELVAPARIYVDDLNRA